MSRIPIFIFLLLFVNVSGDDFNVSCYQMGDDDYYGSVEKSEYTCFTIRFHFNKISFTVKAPDDGTLTVFFKICDVIMPRSYDIEPSESKKFMTNSQKLFEKKICEASNRTDEIDVGVFGRDDSKSFSFMVRNNNKIGTVKNHTLTFMALILGVAIYCLIIYSIIYCLCLRKNPNRNKRNNEMEMSNLNTTPNTPNS